MKLSRTFCARFVALALTRLALGIIVSLALGSAARANNDSWDGNGVNPPNGIWGTGANWLDNTTPGGSDQATISLAGTYTVTFNANPAAIQDLFVINAGTNVTFASSGGTRTLSATSATPGGGRDVLISDGGSLSVGSGTAVNLAVGDDLRVQLGGTLNVNAGSVVGAPDLFLSWGGTAVVSDIGSSLSATASASVGDVAATSTLTYRNNATGTLAPAGTVNVGVAAAGILYVELGADLEVGSLNVGTGSAATGTINLSGSGSTLFQSGADINTVGAASGGVGAINVGTINTGGALTTGTGLTTINTTGVVTLGNGANTGTLNANGNVTVDGGILQRNSGSTFALAAGKTLTIQNGGRASFTGDYSAGTNTIYNIGGTNSKLETLGGGALMVNNGAQVNVAALGLLSLSGNLEIGNGTSGTLSANGFANGVAASITQSGAGTLTVGHATTGTAAINIGTGPTGGILTTGSGLFTINKTGTVTVGSGTPTFGLISANGDITIDGGVLQLFAGASIFFATGKTITVQNGGRFSSVSGAYAPANGFLNITGTNSRWDGGVLFIKDGAQVNVNSGGLLSGYAVTMSDDGTPSTLNIGTTVSGGTLNPSLLNIYGLGTVNIGSTGTLNLQPGGRVTVDGGVLQVTNSGSNVQLDYGQFLTMQNGGRATFDLDGANYTAKGAYDVTGTNSKWEFVDGSGLTIGISSLVNVSLGGSLSVAGDVSLLAFSSLTIDNGSTLTAGGDVSLLSDGSLTIDNGSTLTAGGDVSLLSNGSLTIDNGSTLTANALSVSFNGTFNFTSGTLGITGPAGLTLAQTTLGIGVNNFSVDPIHNLNVTNTTTIPLGWSLAVDGGTLNTGSLVVNGAFSFHSGTLGITGPAGLTIGAGGPLGSTLLIDATRTLHVTNTLTVDSGSFLTAYYAIGKLSAGNVVNNGDLVVINSAVDAPIVNNNAVTVVGSVDFNGLVSGPGGFFGPGTAHFNGGLAPGASPAQVSFEGNLALADTNTLFIEIGGTTPGSQYDRLTIAGSASLDGNLNVSLINGFTPTGGQQFTIVTASSIINNGFVLTGSAANSFNLLVNSTSVILQAIGLAGDYNHNNIVDAADYTVYRDTLGQSGTGLAADGNGSGTIDPGDYDVWKTHFGESSGSGSAGASPSQAAVPEPATAVLLIVGILASLTIRRAGCDWLRQ